MEFVNKLRFLPHFCISFVLPKIRFNSVMVFGLQEGREKRKGQGKIPLKVHCIKGTLYIDIKYPVLKVLCNYFYV